MIKSKSESRSLKKLVFFVLDLRSAQKNLSNLDKTMKRNLTVLIETLSVHIKLSERLFKTGKVS